MAGTSTAPAVTATPTGASVTIHLIDASGDLYTEDLPVSTTAAAGDIAGLVASYQAASNASVWKVTRESVWEGVQDTDNAVATFRSSIAEGINMLFRNTTTFLARSLRLVAPIAATMQGNQDIPLISSTEMVNLITDYLTLSSGYDLESAQFTGRRERRNNPKIRI